MINIETFRELFESNEVSYNITPLYNEDGYDCGKAIWLEKGHLEFDKEGTLTNIITW